MSSMAIRHVLFDADEVIQRTPGGWYAAMVEAYLGDRSREFLHWTWRNELPPLAGQGDFLPLFAQDLRDFGVDAPAAEVFADVWCRIEVDETSVAIVRALRERGFGVHLGTNQEQHRGGYMKAALGYEELFDVHCYSFELGVAKPEPAFFVEAVRRIGADPGSVLFIDDRLENVEGARSVGLHAIHWDLEQGHDVLLDALGAHGVSVRLERG